MSPDQLVFLLGILTDLLAAAQQEIAAQRDEIAVLKAEQTPAPDDKAV
jgi:hypothetical protein